MSAAPAARRAPHPFDRVRERTRRMTRVAQVMGLPVSVHIHIAADAGSPADRLRLAADTFFAELRDMDAMFSPFRPDSAVSLVGAGRLRLDEAPPAVREVAQACARYECITGGCFSAHWRGPFDPTGYVKGWAVERAFERHLAPLADAEPAVVAVGANAGGDMQLRTAAGRNWEWHVAISDPEVPGITIASLNIRDGAVATSGFAARGRHILDPRTGAPCATVASATIVGTHLTEADVWATAAVVAGFDDLRWVAKATSTSGLLVAPGGATRRWSHGAEVSPDDVRRARPRR